MKKTLKIIFIAVTCALVALLLVTVMASVGIVGFVSYVWGGMRLTPDAAIGAVGTDKGELEYVEADGLRVYYKTVSDGLGTMAPEIPDDYMCEIYPVVREKVLWYAQTKPRGYAVVGNDKNETRGEFYQFESDGKYHNFFIPNYKFDEETYTYSLPDSLSSGYDTAIINNTEQTLIKHAYFVTDTDIDEFEINGVTFEIQK